MSKIIVSGNKNYGLAKVLYEKFPKADFCSRSNGEFDFLNNQRIEDFAIKSLEYDVYISCSYIPNFGQINLLRKVYETWQEVAKKGRMIVFGSTADWGTKVWYYPTEKRALRDFCRRYGSAGSGGGPNLHKGNGILITYIAPGMIDLPRQREKYGMEMAKVDPYYLAGIVKWIMEQPEDLNIYDISMDPVQQ